MTINNKSLKQVLDKCWEYNNMASIELIQANDSVRGGEKNRHCNVSKFSIK
jgi:hypothetical protein